LLPSRWLDLSLLLVCSAAPGGVRTQEQAAQIPREPDRGLDAELRARLARVDPALDSWAVERWAAEIEPRLALVARLWSSDRLGELDGEAWLAPELRVAPLFVPPEDAPPARAGWSVWQAGPGTGAEDSQSFPAALAAWRARFPGAARLDFELYELDGDESELRARIRAVASGALADARAQHDADWSCRWRLGAGGAVLTGLQVARLESATLAGHPRGLFADVSESVLGPLYAAEVAPGLDDWRRTLPAPLEPGSLGHHGLAVGDVDGDGLEDLYWCRPGGLPNKLLLHQADGRVRDASAASGVDLLDYSSSALLLELDGDGDLDLVVGTGAGLVFFANDGRGRFERALFLERSLPTSLAAADHDADGDLDLYVCSYVSPYERDGTPLPYHAAENGEANWLLRNDGEWRLVEVSAELGLDANNHRFSLAASWEDFDADGDADLYVANDFGKNNLYRNDGGRFRDVAEELGALDISAGMGVAWGDVDEDGWPDLYVTNLHSPAGRRLTARPDFRPGSTAATREAFRQHASGNSLLRNDQGRRFVDTAATSGTALGRWGWGAIFLDLDLDGALDLFAPNGFVTGEDESRGDLDGFFWRQVVLQSPDGPEGDAASYHLGWRAVRRLVRQGWSWNGHERNVALRNLGRGDYVDVSSVAGLDHADDARAAARVDWDGDGDEDLIVANRTAPMLRFLRNDAAPGAGWVGFVLDGAGRTAVGARVTLELEGGRRLVRTLACGEGYLAQSSARVTFGLGTGAIRSVAIRSVAIRSVTVRWPGGASEAYEGVSGDAAFRLVRGSGRAHRLERGSSARLAAGEPPAAARAAAARTVLPTPLPLARLAVETAEGRPASLFGITLQGPRGTGYPFYLQLWSESEPESVAALATLEEHADALRAAGLQVLALSLDAGEGRARATARLVELRWSAGKGFVGEEALAILSEISGALHDDARALALPAGFLVDPGGRLVATWSGGVDAARLLADLTLFTLTPSERRDACVPFPGTWLGPLPDSLDETVAARLAARGLERPASEYRLPRVEVRAASKATFHYDLGVTRQGEGRLAEAIAHYRQALAVDPGHVQAAQNLAAALHQKGEHAAALAAYREALRLEPGNAMTRCNLGYLHLTMGDLDGARAELAALRVLGSELADDLERELQRSEAR
jgi:tetratricopeptide (TPR) repeat protein